MELPQARGPISAALLEVLGAEPGPHSMCGVLREAVDTGLAATQDVCRDEDLQLTLFCLYQLHYQGLADVSDRWEWDPELIGVRAGIEQAFESALRARVSLPPAPVTSGAAVAAALFELTGQDTGPSLSRFVARSADREQVRELLVHRSVYQLIEADPHSWAIPRLTGRAKAALVEIEADEYGGGRPERMHSALFATTLRGTGLDDRYGAYLGCVPALTLASANMMSLFGLHRRLRGAVAGHLAAIEMTSTIPNRLYGNGFRRLGYDEAVTRYFDEHVEADAVHEQIAAHDLVGALVTAEPALVDDVMFGAAACLLVDAWVSRAILAAWDAGLSCLREPLREAA